MNADGTVPEDNPFPGSINLIRAGANYGWPTVEGTSTDDRFTNPVLQWRPAEASPSGAAIAGDNLFVAALRGQRLWQVPLTGDGTLGTGVAQLQRTRGRLRSVAVVVNPASVIHGWDGGPAALPYPLTAPPGSRPVRQMLELQYADRGRTAGQEQPQSHGGDRREGDVVVLVGGDRVSGDRTHVGEGAAGPVLQAPRAGQADAAVVVEEVLRCRSTTAPTVGA